MASSSDLRARLGRAVFEQAPCLIAVVDAEHRIVAANAAFEQTFGRRGEGELCHVVYKGRQTPCEDCPAARVLADGAPHSSQEEGRDGGGRPLHYEVRCVPAPVSGEEDPARQVLQMAVNVTARRELEQALSQAERLANVGMTTAGLAHTIKNILGGLEGGSYVVSSGLEREDPERIRGGWSMVQKYIEQVTGLVRNLLSYARAEQPEREEVTPAELVQEVVDLFASKADLVGIDVQTRVEPELDPIAVDRQGMHSCLSNLVTNAMDACSWDPDTDKEHRIVVSAAGRPDGGVAFAVEDNGMGIAEEDQPRVLRSFFTTKGIRGTGLGLLLTKKTVEEHGGTLSFTTTPGEGTTFTIALPPLPDSEAG